MSLMASTMLPLGTKAPDFKLKDAVTDQVISLGDVKSDKGTVVMFICNHCPFVKHVQQQLTALANDYMPKGIAFVAISSNDVEDYPEDAPAKMQEEAVKARYPFPYLYDKSQAVAKAYQAACTPDFYIFDKDLNCVYRGQLDDSRPGNGVPVTGKDIRNALENMLAGKAVDTRQKPSQGCNIKWKR